MDEWKEDKPVEQSAQTPQSFGWDAESIYI